MTHAPATGATFRRCIVASLAALALVLASCGSTSPTATPAARAAASAGGAPAASQPPSAASTPSPPPALASQVAAHEPVTIHVLEDPIDFTDVPVGSLTKCTNSSDCLGDQLIGRSRMLDAATHNEIGAFLVNCVLLDPAHSLYSCPANTITLTGRGQIVFTESLLFTRDASKEAVAAWTPWPITGGTGEFLGATGTVDSPADSTWSYGDFVITLLR